ncbi:MAG: hypothetical protein GVY04_19420 [Cyanobacteria bacterium]|nr:hypothetical protein [Cyanobacteria bacterium GSL.Bin1]
MNLEQIKQQIRYLTNQNGKTTDVLIPLETWETILEALTAEYDLIDSKEEIIADRELPQPAIARLGLPTHQTAKR